MKFEQNLTEAEIKQRIKLLTMFVAQLNDWMKPWSYGEDRTTIRSAINLQLRPAGMAVVKAGIRKTLSGPGFDNIDPFTNIFLTVEGNVMMVHARDAAEQAIGIYAQMLSDPKLMLNLSNDALDLEAAIERAIRPTFREGPPQDEKAVQDAVQNTLNALGILHSREREAVSIGGKSFKPDFIIEALDMAVEVKYARGNRGPADLQEEMAADVAAYSTRWTRILFVVYDNGTIADPYQFRIDNIRKLQTSVVIVKH